RTADLITHLRSLDSSYRAACTDAQLALLPPPMAITIYFIASSLRDRLASVRDALLLKHPSELTIEVLESALKDVESNLRSVASASGVVPPPLFHGCTVPQLPTFTTSLATAATDVTAAAVMTSSRSRGRSGRRGGQGAGGGDGGGVGDVASSGGGSAGAGGAPRVAAGDSPTTAGGGDARVYQPPTGQPAAGGARRSQPCGRSHPPGQYFAQLTDTLVGLFGTPHAMYAVVDSSASDSVYSSVVSLGASLAEVLIASVGTCVDTSPRAALEDASLSFTLDSGASHCFFRDCTTLTPLPTPVSVALADPTSGPVTARYTTTLPCPAVPSGSLTGFHVPSFSRNLVGVRPLVSQHVGVWIEPSGETAVCVDGDTAVAIAAAAAEAAALVAAAAEAAAAAAIAAAAAAATAPDPCHCPSLGSRVSPGCRVSPGSCVWSGLPHVLPSLPPSLAPPCGPCVEGRLRATPHSSSLRPTTEPFKTLHLDVWGPASRPGPERESFFLVVVDDYSRYTTVFPPAKKSDVTSTLIWWLLTTADTRGHRVSCLHSDHGGEFCSGILAGFCREQGICQSWTLPDSPQQNGVVERRIGLVMEIARTSMTHARAPHFLWPYTVRYATHQLNLWPRVSQTEVSPTSLWTGSPGAASRFRVWGCLALARDTSTEKILPRAVSCVYPSRGLPVPPAPLFLNSAPPPAPLVQPPPPGPALSGVSHATPPPSVAPQVQPLSPQSSSQPTVDPAGASFCGEDPGGASSRGARVGAESVPVRGPGSGGAGVGAEPVTAGDSSLRGAGVSGAVPGGATIGGAPSTGLGEPGTDPHQARVRRAREEQLQLDQEERELEQQQVELQRLEQQPEQEQPQQQQPPPPPISGLRTLGLPSPSPPSPPSPPVCGPSLLPPDPSTAVFPPPLPPLSPPLSHTWPSRRSPRARPSSPVPFTDLRTALFCSSPPRLSPSVLPSPLEPALTASLSTPVTDFYRTYRPVLSRVLASLVTDPRASMSSVSALTTAVTEFASTRCLDYATSLVAAPPTSPLAVGVESALGCDALEDRPFELEFLAATSPHLCAMLLAPEGDPDALDISTPRTYAEAVSGPWASQWRAAMDSEMASYRSTVTYVDEVPPLGANVVDGMWILRVKRSQGSPPVFKARYVARGFSQHEGVDFFQTFAPTPKITTLRPSSTDLSLFVRRGSTPFFVLVYVDDLVFATANRVVLADVKLELQKRHSCTDLGELHHYLGLHITRDKAARTITLSQSHMVQHVLQRFELQHSTVQRIPLAVDHRLTGSFLDEPFEPSGPYAELVGCLISLDSCCEGGEYLATTSGMGLVLGGRQDVVLIGHCDSSYTDDAETHRSTQGYCFSLGSGAVSWRSTRSSLVSTSTGEAEIYDRAMAAQELCWLTFLHTDLSERPSSALTLFTDN
ncbi:unnamed protein product, partial [Closterium sp. NIES-53]